MARKNVSITGFLNDVVGNTKDLFDDVIDRAQGVERDVRNSIGSAVSFDRPEEKVVASRGAATKA